MVLLVVLGIIIREGGGVKNVSKKLVRVGKNYTDFSKQMQWDLRKTSAEFSNMIANYFREEQERLNKFKEWCYRTDKVINDNMSLKRR